MAETGTIPIDGARIAYTDYGGDGPAVLHAHGLSSCRGFEAESGLIDPAAFADAGCRLIAYDARAHGESSGGAEPRDPSQYLWDNLGEDLLAVADAFSPAAPVHAMGISMGTATILHALVRRPERFRSVVLGAPPTAWETRADQAAVYERLAAAVEASPEGAVEVMSAMPVPEIFADLAAEPHDSAVAPALLPSVLRGAGRSDLPEPEAVAAVAVPALILAWAGDPGHPESTADRLAGLLPDAAEHISTTAADVDGWPRRAAEFFAVRG